MSALDAEPTSLHPGVLGATCERVIADIGDPSAGATLIVVAAVHGNEPSGAQAAQRVAAELDALDALRGRFVALVGNTRALSAGVRFIERDLNRSWRPSHVAGAQETHAHGSADAEDKELVELKAAIDSAIHDAGQNSVVLIDLHTTSSSSTPFIAVEDRLHSRRLAVELGVTTVFGIESLLSGLLISHVLPNAHATLVFEAGQHTAAESPDRHAAAIRTALSTYRITDESFAQDSRMLLHNACGGQPLVLEARDRHPIAPSDQFSMNPGFANFTPVKRDQELARDRHGSIRAARSGRIFMPLYQPLGEDGFFLVKPVSPAFWYASRCARLLKLRRYVRFLPGVLQVPNTDAFIVNARLARYLRRQLFATLGYRRTDAIGQLIVFAKNDVDQEAAVAFAESLGR